MTDREEAITWWHTMSFEEQLCKIIEVLETKRHPNLVTGREIEKMWKQENNIN